MPDVPALCHRWGGKPAERSPDRVIAELAARQHGLTTAAQLVAAGLTRRMIERRARRGLLHRVHRGVYSVGCEPVGRGARWLAAVLACGPDAVLSHVAAAALWAVRETAATVIDVTSPTGSGRGRRGIRVHHAALAGVDVTVRDGIPVTSLPRTIVDLATMVSPGALEYAIHRAEARRMLTPADLHETLDRLRGKKGTGPVRAIVGAAHHDLDARTRGPWERRFLALCRGHDIPEPMVNRWIALEIASGGLEVDFSWARERLVVEVDEEASHHTLRAQRNDPARDRALRAAGWRVVRVAQSEFARPARIAAKVRTALGDRSSQPRRRFEARPMASGPAPDRYPRPPPWRRRSSP
jgi:hypothetical protein